MSKKAKPWKTLSSKLILNHRLLKVTENKVKLPDGSTSTYVRHAPSSTDSVAIIAQNTKGLLLLQKEYSYPPDKVMYQLPGGSMKPGETVAAAAKRELSEESGYSAKNTKILGAYFTNNRWSDKKQHVVLCTGLFESKLAEDYDEFIESTWISRKALLAMITAGKIDNINLLAAINIYLNSKPGRGKS